MAEVKRIYPAELPATQRDSGPPWEPKGLWPARWVYPPEGASGAFASVFRVEWRVKEATQARVHVTADERYELFVDGECVARGPERGDRANWYYDSFDITFDAGTHMIVACVWNAGDLRAWAQSHVRAGFLLYAEGGELEKVISTGMGEWKTRRAEGIEFLDPSPQSEFGVGIGPMVRVDAEKFVRNWCEVDEGWNTAASGHAGNNGFLLSPFNGEHLLRPATLPPQMQRRIDGIGVRRGDATGAWAGLIAGGEKVNIGVRMTQRVLLDLGNYYGAYPTLVTTGGKGSVVRIAWAESLQDANASKGHRDEIEGKTLRGFGDEFRPDGRERVKFTVPWWRAGRYVEVDVATGDEELVVEELAFEETRYPLEADAGAKAWRASNAVLTSVLRVAQRTLQACAHETYMDCPYYEQLMYIGDTRLQVLTTHVLTADVRLPRKALTMMNSSAANHWGIPTDAYPAGGKFIPPFALWFVSMLYDHAMYRGERKFLSRMLPTARTVVERFLERVNGAGLVISPPGWNFMDWARGWDGGIPPGGKAGEVSALVNMQVLQALRHLCVLERWVEETEFAARAERKSAELSGAIDRVFWDETRGLFADDVDQRMFSQHAQALAVLADAGAPGRSTAGLRRVMAAGESAEQAVTATSIYFTHYLFEAAAKVGAAEVIFSKLAPWYHAFEQGFKTFPEIWGETRSDCHAWAAHPLFHFFSSLLGVRPAAPGFEVIEIRPCLGKLKQIGGYVPHPLGRVGVTLEATGEGIVAEVDMPDCAGHLIWRGTRHALRGGMQRLELPEMR